MKNNVLRKTVSAFAAAAMMISAFPVASYAVIDYADLPSNNSYSTEMRGLTAFQIVSDMGAGWNLGNSLESTDNEKSWGNPVTTKAMIDAIAAKGFNTLRVPVRWDDHYSNASAFTIDSSFMNRVEEVVNYGLDNDMYVILNVHHNDLQHNVPNTDAISSELKAIWTQVGERFKNYGDKLIFEVNNEPRCGDDWTGNSTYYESVNQCNEAARAAIRATGGNNTNRLVMLPTYCASGDDAKAAAWTKNTNDDMIAASIHAYLPFDFAFNGTGHTNWQASDLTELKGFFSRMYTYFLSKNIPVVIGEFGTCNKNNTNAREQCTEIYVELARQFAEQDIPCVVWDNNCYNVGAENFGLFKRSEGTFAYEGIVDALVDGYDGDPEYEIASVSEIIVSSEGGSTSGGWGQAVCFSGSVINDMSSGQSVYVNYTCQKQPFLILQDNDIGSWVSITADSASNGVAIWSYDTIVSAYASTGAISGVDNVFIGDDNAALTVTKVYVNNPNAHTHNYNGATVTTLEATATTHGRKTVACTVSGCNAYKVTVTDPITEATKPTVTATAGEESVSLKWDAINGATKYAVSSYLNGKYKTYTTSLNFTSYIVTGLTGGVEYGFLVQAYVNGAWTTFTTDDLVKATPIAIAKPKPTATPADSAVILNWKAVDGATKYAVSVYSGGKYFVQTKDLTDTTYTVKPLKNNVAYQFLVQAYINGKWTTALTSDLISCTPVATAKPKPTATPADGAVILNWKAVDGATKYAVSVYSGGKYFVQTKSLTSTTYTVKPLKNNVAYQFLVQAYIDGQWTIASTADLISCTPMATAKPKPTATPADGAVILNWESVEGATKYAVSVYSGGKYFVQTTELTDTTYTVKPLKNNVAYQFLVQAFIGGKWTTASTADLVSCTPLSTQ